MQQQISHIVFTVVTYLRVMDPWTFHLLLFLQFHQLYVGKRYLHMPNKNYSVVADIKYSSYIVKHMQYLISKNDDKSCIC